MPEENVQLKTKSKTNVAEKIGVIVIILGAFSLLASMGIFLNAFLSKNKEKRTFRPDLTLNDIIAPGMPFEYKGYAFQNGGDCNFLLKDMQSSIDNALALGTPPQQVNALEPGHFEWIQLPNGFWYHTCMSGGLECYRVAINVPKSTSE